MPRSVAMYDLLSNEDPRGTRVRDAASLESLLDSDGIGKKEAREHAELPPEEFLTLRDLLNSERRSRGEALFNDDVSSTERNLHVILHPKVKECRHLMVGGVRFQSAKHSYKNSNVIYSCDGVHAGRIINIFIHERHDVGGRMEDIFLVIRRLVPLTRDDLRHDVFRSYRVGGYLRYDRYKERLDIIRPQSVLCHFARTPYHVVDAVAFVHVRPLDTLARISGFRSDDDDAMGIDENN
ncbi:hypothetical protein K474DRAFT_1714319 [Panus rudis PR-1116 ss-1]|nr:hypothetical protein K474DRAFT_1714319 [Panus rudis PR-1116 ss-1]